jgi:hypothetical protein
MKSPLLVKFFTFTVLTSCTFAPLEAKSQSIQALGASNSNYKGASRDNCKIVQDSPQYLVRHSFHNQFAKRSHFNLSNIA